MSFVLIEYHSTAGKAIDQTWVFTNFTKLAMFLENFMIEEGGDYVVAADKKSALPRKHLKCKSDIEAFFETDFSSFIDKLDTYRKSTTILSLNKSKYMSIYRAELDVAST